MNNGVTVCFSKPEVPYEPMLLAACKRLMSKTFGGSAGKNKQSDQWLFFGVCYVVTDSYPLFLISQ